MPSKIEEATGVSFSLSFLIQVIGAIVIAVWGYSQLDGRLSYVENATASLAESVEVIETDMHENQAAPISSDYTQNARLEALEQQIIIYLDRIEILEQRLYDLAQNE